MKINMLKLLHTLDYNLNQKGGSLSTAPMKIIAPETISLIVNMKGWFAMKFISGVGAMNRERSCPKKPLPLWNPKLGHCGWFNLKVLMPQFGTELTSISNLSDHFFC